MTVYIGSARKDSRGKYSGDKAGDQLQKAVPDRSGEVSQQPFYRHSKGWNVLRLKDRDKRNLLAKKMRNACDNVHVGYDQAGRYGILRNGTTSTTDTECDCSSLVRQCVIEACGIDLGDFSTETERAALKQTGLFEDLGAYTDAMTLCTGDVLVTRTKGHTAIVTKTNGGDGELRKDMPLVQYGSEGTAVKVLQKTLQGKGYQLSVDGDFGGNTLTKVKNFQKASGLAQDGRCGAKTWKALMGY